jgi:hypothetical protein
VTAVEKNGRYPFMLAIKRTGTTRPARFDGFDAFAEGTMK